MDHLRALAKGTLDKARATWTTLREHFAKVWRAHLDRLEHSPAYEAVLLALIDLVLGHRLDIHELLTRLMTRMRRTPPEIPDGWAY